MTPFPFWLLWIYTNFIVSLSTNMVSSLLSTSKMAIEQEFWCCLNSEISLFHWNSAESCENHQIFPAKKLSLITCHYVLSYFLIGIIVCIFQRQHFDLWYIFPMECLGLFYLWLPKTWIFIWTTIVEWPVVKLKLWKFIHDIFVKDHIYEMSDTVNIIIICAVIFPSQLTFKNVMIIFLQS